MTDSNLDQKADVVKAKKATVTTPLSHTLTLFCFLSAIVFVVCLGAMSFIIYEQDMMQRYQHYAADVLDFMSNSIDGEDLARCIDDKRKSVKYIMLQKLADDIKETHKIEYLYILRPMHAEPPDNVINVLFACTERGYLEGREWYANVGESAGNDYPAEIAKKYLERMDTNPNVTFFYNNSEYGDVYTAVRPIFNSKGYPIAVLCADLRLDDIHAGAYRFLRMCIFASITLGLLLTGVMSLWLHRRVVVPLKRIRDSAATFAERSHESRNLEEIYFDDPKIATKDEIGELAGALSAMTNDIKAYAEELIMADREVWNLKTKVEEMGEIAYKDALTGAENKAAYAQEFIELSREMSNGGAVFSMMMVDLNYLKRINDNYGHEKGDLYISGLYRILRATFPARHIFRIGGDEFLVLLRGKNEEAAAEAAQNLKDILAKMRKDPTLEPWEQISAAVGYAAYDETRHQSPADVFKDADYNMYEHKKAMHAGRE